MTRNKTLTAALAACSLIAAAQPASTLPRIVDSRVHTVDDLEEGMVLPGIVTNITNFGAFVDLGVHQDGLIHISQMANRRINHPTDVVKLHQHVEVKVLDVDRRRNRIALTLKFRGFLNLSFTMPKPIIYDA